MYYASICLDIYGVYTVVMCAEIIFYLYIFVIKVSAKNILSNAKKIPLCPYACCGSS